MSYRRGYFVVIDGPSGVGKTTVTQHLRIRFKMSGMSVLTTREPTGSAIGEMARAGAHTYDGLTLACLVAADRYDHLKTQIRPALERGELVLCDRYLSTSLVLQVGDGVPEEMIWQLNQFVDKPVLTIILLGDPALSRKRAGMRGTYSKFHEGGAQAGALEVERYRAIVPRLESIGMRTVVYDVGERNGVQVADEIAAVIAGALSDRESLHLCGAHE